MKWKNVNPTPKTGLSPIVPIRMNAEFKSHCRLAAEHEGFDSVSAWVKAQCQKRINELHNEKRFQIALKDLPY